MHPTLLNRHEVEDIHTWLIQERDHLEAQVPVSGIDAAVERMLFRRQRAQAALGRLDAGTYGACCQCGQEVEVEVLRLDPAAPLCADCQSEFAGRRIAA
jgi:RNA polymerase-binding transcription factor DksA